MLPALRRKSAFILNFALNQSFKFSEFLHSYEESRLTSPIEKQEILEKINNVSVAAAGQPKPTKPKVAAEPKPQESKAHQADESKDGTNVPDANVPKPKKPKAEKSVKPKAPQPKVAKFPVKGTINKYAFIGLTNPLVNALGLPLKLEGNKGKLAYDIAIEFCSYDQQTNELRIRILQVPFPSFFEKLVCLPYG
jgi:hypothetical protein